MTDYSTLSDAELAERIAIARGCTEDGMCFSTSYSPCTNREQAAELIEMARDAGCQYIGDGGHFGIFVPNNNNQGFIVQREDGSSRYRAECEAILQWMEAK